MGMHLSYQGRSTEVCLFMGLPEPGAGLKTGEMIVSMTNLKIGIGEQFGFWIAPATVCSIVDLIAFIIIIICLVYHSKYGSEVSLLVVGQRWKALKELLTLLAYPIIFCILMIPPVVNRIYGAVFNTVSVTANLVSGSIIPLQPFFAGLTLLIHVCVLKVPKCITKCNCNRRYNQYSALPSTFV